MDTYLVRLAVGKLNKDIELDAFAAVNSEHDAHVNWCVPERTKKIKNYPTNHSLKNALKLRRDSRPENNSFIRTCNNIPVISEINRKNRKYIRKIENGSRTSRFTKFPKCWPATGTAIVRSCCRPFGTEKSWRRPTVGTVPTIRRSWRIWQFVFSAATFRTIAKRYESINIGRIEWIKCNRQWGSISAAQFEQ